MTGQEKESRLVVLALHDQDGLDVTLHNICIRTSLPDADILPAIKAAAQEYLDTPDGLRIWDENCECFNYGDFDLNVPDEVCGHHGFHIIRDDIMVMEDDFNICLASPSRESETAAVLTFPMISPVQLERTVEVFGRDIDDILDTAMAGCTHWCDHVDPIGPYLGKYASEQVSRGGRLIFTLMDEDRSVELDRDKFLCGLRQWLQSIDDMDMATCGRRIDPGQIDSDAADMILQYALFGELVYS